jgi:hypothetical protein
VAIAWDTPVTVHGGANTFVSAEVDYPAGTLLIIGVACYAGSGDDASTQVVYSDPPGTVTEWVERSQLDDGSGISPPPVAIWAHLCTGGPQTITSEAVDAIGSSHAMTIWPLTGYRVVDPVVYVADESTMTGVALVVESPVDDCVVFAAAADWGDADEEFSADANSTTDYSVAIPDTIQPSWFGHRVLGAAGTYTIGTLPLVSHEGTNACAIVIAPAVDEPEEYFLSGSWSAASEMTASPVTAAHPAGAWSAASSLTASPVTAAHPTAAWSAESSLTASPVTTAYPAGSWSAASDLTGSPVVTAHPAGSWSAASEMTATPVTAAHPTAVWSAASGLTGTPVVTAYPAGTWSAASSMTVSPEVTYPVTMPGWGTAGGTTPAATAGGSTPGAIASGYP